MKQDLDFYTKKLDSLIEKSANINYESMLNEIQAAAKGGKCT